LTEFERRLFLDLPTEDLETSNIRAATILSREQLIEKAKSSRQQEFLDGWEGEASYEVTFKIGSMEGAKRNIEARSQTLRAAANLVLPDAKEWIQHLYQQEKKSWGFICLYDAAVQKFNPQRLDHFECTKDGFFRHALMYNGSKDIIDTKWGWFPYNAPNNILAPITNLESDNDYPNGVILRKAFQEILRDPQEYQKRDDVTPTITYTGHFKDGIAKAGFLTNTF
ncbi:uncharacterized protein K444DRAFT_474843, partial [Hyaloscypha bicolor E]